MEYRQLSSNSDINFSISRLSVSDNLCSSTFFDADSAGVIHNNCCDFIFQQLRTDPYISILQNIDHYISSNVKGISHEAVSKKLGPNFFKNIPYAEFFVRSQGGLVSNTVFELVDGLSRYSTGQYAGFADSVIRSIPNDVTNEELHGLRSIVSIAKNSYVYWTNKGLSGKAASGVAGADLIGGAYGLSGGFFTLFVCAASASLSAYHNRG